MRAGTGRERTDGPGTRDRVIRGIVRSLCHLAFFRTNARGRTVWRYQVHDEEHPPAFYQEYVKDVQATIEENAQLEFECLWNVRVALARSFFYIRAGH